MTPENKKAQELADFIEAHPHCKIDIDNDCWYILEPIKGEKTELQELVGEEYEENQIADSSEYNYQTRWYGHSSNYGAGIAEALVILLNRRGFKIEASAV